MEDFAFLTYGKMFRRIKWVIYNVISKKVGGYEALYGEYCSCMECKKGLRKQLEVAASVPTAFQVQRERERAER